MVLVYESRFHGKHEAQRGTCHFGMNGKRGNNRELTITPRHVPVSHVSMFYNISLSIDSLPFLYNVYIFGFSRIKIVLCRYYQYLHILRSYLLIIYTFTCYIFYWNLLCKVLTRVSERIINFCHCLLSIINIYFIIWSIFIQNLLDWWIKILVIQLSMNTSFLIIF